MRGSIERPVLPPFLNEDTWVSHVKRIFDRAFIEISEEIQWLNKETQTHTIAPGGSNLVVNITSPVMAITVSSSGANPTIATLKTPPGFRGPLVLLNPTSSSDTWDTVTGGNISATSAVEAGESIQLIFYKNKWYPLGI